MSDHRLLANAIRALSMDAVQQANSGHPGMPMGMADIATVLWGEYLQHNPKDPTWANRDRFVLSNGHGSMLLYSLLHLTGYDLSLDDIKSFRQLHSKTPGHPEYRETPGVETTTGPLGQGLANAVGMAIAEKQLAAQFNREHNEIIDHHTYVFAGDGCLMEGVSHEACSLAGTLGLGKLIVFWDDNHISIDGEVSSWFGESVPDRFAAYQWQVIDAVDGHDPDAIRTAIEAAKADTDKPTLICCRTIIGYGSPKVAGSEKSHGAPLGDAEIAATKAKLGWPHGAFEIPEEVYAAFDGTAKGLEAQQKWQSEWEAYQGKYPEKSADLLARWENTIPAAVSQQCKSLLQTWQDKGEAVATRKASLQVLNEIGPKLPALFGGSADLTGSNLTRWAEQPVFNAEQPTGSYLHYGVREFGMAAIMNGLALYGAHIPYGGTFLTFLDYMRNAVRMSALMEIQAIYVFTHDSIGLGEDGPTHQPVEHLAMLRATPGVAVWRPADSVETIAAWQSAIESSSPTCLSLTRQSCPVLERQAEQLPQIAQGGYVLWESDAEPQTVFIATGSEVSLALEVAQNLASTGQKTRVVSMPCLEVFLSQPEAYQEAVLPQNTKRVAIEAASSQSWYQLVGRDGLVVGMDSFGLSAPAKDLFQHYGFDADKIITMLNV